MQHSARSVLSLSRKMIREHFEYKQTITTILTDTEEDAALAKIAMFAARQDLENTSSATLFL